LAPKQWRSIAALHAESESRQPLRSWSWWQIPALAAAVCLMVAGVMIWRRPVTVQASELLARSANAETPSDRMISMRVHGRTLVRPAVLTTTDQRDGDMAHLKSLFAEANYNWQSPLSARSFLGWRTGLRDRQDTVSVIDAGGPEEAYRVQTDTPKGVLRSASLLLRGKALRATGGRFQFAGEDALEMAEEASAPGPTKLSPPPIPAREAPATETPASPADALHVLAALNEIGADVTDPIVVSEDDRGQILVRATALSAGRQQEVATALGRLPHVRLELDTPPSNPRSSSAPLPTPQRFSTGMPEALRHQLEDRLGGASGLQEITDSVLDAGSLLLARAHAIETLAGTFPPERESSLSTADRDLLRTLRQRHAAELQRLTARIRAALKPVLPASAPAASQPAPEAWQTQVRELIAAAHKLDSSLNRLLAGSYSQSQGEAMLRELDGELERLEKAIQFQRDGGR
jgi:hypothetical protein